MRLFLASAIIATSAAATFMAVTGPASAETRSYSLSGFTKIEATAGFTIEFTQSPAWSVVIDSEYNNLDKIIVEKVGDTLKISRPKNTHIRGEVHDVIRISAPDIDALNLDAAIRFSAPSLNVDNLAIHANAAIVVDIQNLKTGALDINADAASKITLAGSCTKLDLTIGAATKVMAEGLKCRETHIDAGTASSVHAFASDKAVASAGMASSVLISGHPRDFKESHDRFGSSVSLAD
jgi:hypothetical protein